MKHLSKSAAILFILLLTTAAAHAAEPGWFGVTFMVQKEGFFSQTIRSTTVVSVEPNSPAANSAVKAGDQVLEVEDIPVAGAQSHVMSSILRKNRSETLCLRLRRPSGEIYVVTLTAAARPN